MRRGQFSNRVEWQRRFRRQLLAWFKRNGRDLPWRRTREPYPILVSEVMLQQTQVSRVEGYWPRFLERFPTFEALAKAHPHQVREAWDGLGYYRRAANLHALAREVVTHHDGELPRAPAAMRALPGIGSYTAGAVASFAWEDAVPAIDTNVSRVLRRVFHPKLSTGAAAERTLEETAQALLPRRGSAAWSTNQALMELGALICTARIAHCGMCPVRANCRTGSSHALGAKRSKPIVRSTSRGKT